MPGRECDYKIVMSSGRKVRRYDQGAVRYARESLDGTLDVGNTLDACGHKLKGKGSCSGLGRKKVVVVDPHLRICYPVLDGRQQ
jgi:hypothetical protein